MNIQKVTDNKKAYIDLLLLADEQEDMIDKYLERGEMFVLHNDGDTHPFLSPLPPSTLLRFFLLLL